MVLGHVGVLHVLRLQHLDEQQEGGLRSHHNGRRAIRGADQRAGGTGEGTSTCTPSPLISSWVTPTLTFSLELSSTASLAVSLNTRSLCAPMGNQIATFLRAADSISRLMLSSPFRRARWRSSCEGAGRRGGRMRKVLRGAVMGADNTYMLLLCRKLREGDVAHPTFWARPPVEPPKWIKPGKHCHSLAEPK